MRIPDSFIDLAPDGKKRLLAAPCGPQKALWGILAWLVPDDLLGLDIRLACGIHDLEYREGKNKADKIQADTNFLYNLLYLIQKAGDKIAPRTFLALIYFLAVRFAGGSAFRK